MADNYLERKMEEYRQGAKRPMAKRHTSSSAGRKGMMAVDFPEINVFVTSADEALVRAFSEAGAHVAFCCGVPDMKKSATGLAERTGSRFYPMGEGEALEMYGNPDYIVRRLADGDIKIDSENGSRMVSQVEGDGAERLAVILCSPVFALLRSAVIS